MLRAAAFAPPCARELAAGLDRGPQRTTADDEMKGHLRRLADEVLEAVRVVETRGLDENTVHALTLDARLERAELVDAAVDDLDRLLHDLPHAGF